MAAVVDADAVVLLSLSAAAVAAATAAAAGPSSDFSVLVLHTITSHRHHSAPTLTSAHCLGILTHSCIAARHQQVSDHMQVDAHINALPVT